ncbi:hypothetical protein BgiBS90_012014, partial [Biomphalaria glabrata]
MIPTIADTSDRRKSKDFVPPDLWEKVFPVFYLGERCNFILASSMTPQPSLTKHLKAVK